MSEPRIRVLVIHEEAGGKMLVHEFVWLPLGHVRNGHAVLYPDGALG